MYLEFQAFQRNLLLSLSQSAPLDENLRAVICPTLSKIRNYCGGGVAVHVFIKQEFIEMHALVIGYDPNVRDILKKELERRHTPQVTKSNTIVELPKYKCVRYPSGDDFIKIADNLHPLGEVRTVPASGEMILLFEKIQECFSDEFANKSLTEEDTLLLIPLGTKEYQRLGCIIVWNPVGDLLDLCKDVRKFENILAFRKGMEQLMVRLFTNFYQLEPHTYLPSYYEVGVKPVALLCAEIAEFDRVSEILRKSHHLGAETARECLRKLVNSFADKIAQVVEKECYRGRIDQIEGNRLLVVFGEYVDSPDPSPKAVCARAVSAAALLSRELNQLTNNWLTNEFDFKKYCEDNNEQIILGAAVAVNYGKVVFDYIGSSLKRMYMAIGDHINFVKQMTNLMRPSSLHSSPCDFYSPILLSQTAYASSVHILIDREGVPAGTVHKPKSILLPGRPTPYSVYEIWPENVDDKVMMT